MRKIFRNKTKYTFNYFLVCSHKPLNSKKKILLLLLFLLSQSPKGPSDQLIVWINQSGRKQSRTFDRCTKGRVNIYRGCSWWTRTSDQNAYICRTGAYTDCRRIHFLHVHVPARAKVSRWLSGWVWGGQ